MDRCNFLHLPFTQPVWLRGVLGRQQTSAQLGGLFWPSSRGAPQKRCLPQGCEQQPKKCLLHALLLPGTDKHWGRRFTSSTAVKGLGKLDGSGQSFSPETPWEQVSCSRFHIWLCFCLQPTTVNLSDASDPTDTPLGEMVIILQACSVIIYCKSSSQFLYKVKEDI